MVDSGWVLRYGGSFVAIRKSRRYYNGKMAK
jgi:hypothetical protein